MIFLATFNGRRKDAIGIFYNIKAFCFGEDAIAAHLELYNRFEHITKWKLEPVPIVTAKDCKPGDRICIIENGRTIGDTNPHRSWYVVTEPNEIIGEVCCRNGAGILCQVKPNVECVVANFETPT